MKEEEESNNDLGEKKRDFLVYVPLCTSILKHWYLTFGGGGVACVAFCFPLHFYKI